MAVKHVGSIRILQTPVLRTKDYRGRVAERATSRGGGGACEFMFVKNHPGVADETLFSIVVLMMMLTTLVTPPALGALFRERS